MDARSDSLGKTLADAALIGLVSLACAGSASDEGAGDGRTSAAAPVDIPRSGVFPTSTDHFDRVIGSGDVPTVVNVWASWCIPCRAETPLLVKAARRYQGDIRFLGLNTQDAEEEALEFIREFGIPYPSGLDLSGKVARHLKALGLPVTLFYGRDDELVFVHNGEIRADDLKEKIAELLRLSGTGVEGTPS